MKRSTLVLACVVWGLALLPGTGRSQAPDPPNQILLSRMSGGETLDRFLQNLRRDFANMDADSNGTIDAADVEIHNAMSATAMRMSMAMRTFSFDLDGDGAVTADEVRRKMRYDMRMQNNAGFGGQSPEARIEHEVRNIMAADADNDGRVTWNEAIEYAKKQPQYAQLEKFGPGNSARQMIALAPAGKTSITLAELETAATAFFRLADTDGNGTISLDELQTMRGQVDRAARRAAELRVPTDLKPNCEMPKASAAAKVVLLSAGGTEGLSTIALASQDVVTGVGNINVEPGEGPLYLVVVTDQPTIWHFTGAVDRVERAVLMSNHYIEALEKNTVKQASGATGLPPGRVSFQPRRNCLNHFTAAPTAASAQAAGLVLAAAGKNVDVVSAAEQVTAFSVPSGKVQRIRNDIPSVVVIHDHGRRLEVQMGTNTIRVLPPATLESELLRYNPGGVIAVNLNEVVASVPVERYEVLPEQAGLIQLVKSGALTQTTVDEFIINKKVHLPAGVGGVKFLLKRGVPGPDGMIASDNLISEETGKPLPRKQP